MYIFAVLNRSCHVNHAFTSPADFITSSCAATTSLFQYGLILNGGAYFQRGMSLRAEVWFDHCPHGDRHERTTVKHGGANSHIFRRHTGGAMQNSRVSSLTYSRTSSSGRATLVEYRKYKRGSQPILGPVYSERCTGGHRKGGARGANPDNFGPLTPYSGLLYRRCRTSRNHLPNRSPARASSPRHQGKMR